MKEAEIDQIAEKLTARVVEKLMGTEFHHTLAEAMGTAAPEWGIQF